MSAVNDQYNEESENVPPTLHDELELSTDDKVITTPKCSAKDR